MFNKTSDLSGSCIGAGRDVLEGAQHREGASKTRCNHTKGIDSPRGVQMSLYMQSVLEQARPWQHVEHEWLGARNRGYYI